MAEIRVLKIAADGVPLEHSHIDEIVMASFSVSGGGPVLGVSGLDMTNQDIINVKNLLFFDPATGYINQTVGNLIIDNIMAVDRDNLMTVSGGGILFPIITDTGAEVDGFRLPAVSGTPTAAPTNGGAGYLVYDYANGKPYAWTGTAWDDLTSVTSAENLEDPTYLSGEALATSDVVYLSGSNTVSKAIGNVIAKSYAMGFVVAGVGSGAAVTIRKAGTISGFSLLTPGAREYLHPTVAGAVTENIPTGTGNTIAQVGYARTASSIDIQILQLGRRA